MSTPFAMAALLYFAASFGHFAHNAEFICEYPALPASITSARVILAWLGITAFGVAGFLLLRKRWLACGLTCMAVYAALGFDGLGHYTLAPFAWHTPGANLTILSEVAAAALLLAMTAHRLVRHLMPRRVPT